LGDFRVHPNLRPMIELQSRNKTLPLAWKHGAVTFNFFTLFNF
jgi:hypothetical protein